MHDGFLNVQIAGALAEEGKSLEEVAEQASLAAKSMGNWSKVCICLMNLPKIKIIKRK